MLGAAMVEPFLYHPFITLFSITGYFNYFTRKSGVWGDMNRRGTKGKKNDSINNGGVEKVPAENAGGVRVEGVV